MVLKLAIAKHNFAKRHDRFYHHMFKIFACAHLFHILPGYLVYACAALLQRKDKVCRFGIQQTCRGYKKMVSKEPHHQLLHGPTCIFLLFIFFFWNLSLPSHIQGSGLGSHRQQCLQAFDSRQTRTTQKEYNCTYMMRSVVFLRNFPVLFLPRGGVTVDHSLFFLSCSQGHEEHFCHQLLSTMWTDF